MNKFLSIIIWAALIQGLVLGFTYMFSKKTKSRANTILGIFLLSFVLEAFTSDFFMIDEIYGYEMNYYFSLPEVKLLFPVLFFHYVTEKLGRVKYYKKSLTFFYSLALLAISITVVNIGLFFLMDSTLKDEFSIESLEGLFMVFQYVAFCTCFLSFFLAIREMVRYRRIIENEFTDLTMLQIKWLWQFVFVLLPIIILWGIELIRIALRLNVSSDFSNYTWFFVFIFLYFVSYKTFKHPNLFESIPEPLLEVVGLASNQPQKHECSNEMIDKIQRSMQFEKYYLDPDLTVHSFGKNMSLSPRLISSCINQNVGVNFNEWVNNFRVDDALCFIKSDIDQKLSIEGIGFNSGFKSRSAMYAAFKKKLGHAPGYYRKEEV